MGHHSGRGTAPAAMVHSVLADDDSYGVVGTSKHTDSYILTNNRRVKKELQLFAILAAGLWLQGLGNTILVKLKLWELVIVFNKTFWSATNLCLRYAPAKCGR